MNTFRRIVSSIAVVAWHTVVRYDCVINASYTGIETTVIIMLAATTNYDPQRCLQQQRRKWICSFEISCVVYI